MEDALEEATEAPWVVGLGWVPEPSVPCTHAFCLQRCLAGGDHIRRPQSKSILCPET